MWREGKVAWVVAFCLTSPLGCASMAHAKPHKPSVQVVEKESLSQSHLSSKVEAAIKKTLPNAAIGVMVQDAKTGKILYERKSTERFVPASTAKVLTAAAALVALGPDHRFETTIKALPHSVQGSRIKGHVYLQFTGDPSLKTKDLKALVLQLRTLGVHEIAGNVVIDNTRFEGPNYAPGWTWDSIHWHYSAPITSVILNQNRIGLTLQPGTVPGGAVKADIAGEYRAAFSVESQIQAATAFQANTGCQLLLNMSQENRVLLGGCWPVSQKAVGLRLAVANPDLMAKQVILNALHTAGIRLLGQVDVGVATPTNAVVIAKHASAPLKHLIKYVLKDSNNIYAESLTKTLGFYYFKQGTFQSGVRAIKKILSKPANINVKRMKLLDGSGQSRYNLISPRHLSQVLQMMYHHRVFEDFKSGLAISGKTGTLRGRMGGQGLLGRVEAKTGTLEGVSALSGYLTTKNKQTLVFTIMTDRVVESTRHSKLLEAQLCQIFMTYFTAHPIDPA